MEGEHLDEPFLTEHGARNVAAQCAVVFTGISLMGVAPAVMLWSTSGEWKFDPFYEAGLPMSLPYGILDSHSRMAIAWALAAVLQVAIGVGWVPVPRVVHRVLGYTLCVWGVAAFGSGCVLEMLEYSGVVSFLHWADGVMILLNMVFAVDQAKRRKLSTHSNAALCLIAWCLYPGLARLVGFSLEYFVPCGIDAFGGYEFLTASFCGCLLWSLRTGQTSKPLGVNAVIFGIYATIDLGNALLLGTFLRCPEPLLERWAMFR
ncbi:unnamed protein product [Polarella glacialis]|uniref:Uncharacterized protein n=1 Tax=Polarella glacialis TaxID=89957 RepID=A0A813GZS2_POLGL|nr:unnamed protein product [Polarella glacialis]